MEYQVKIIDNKLRWENFLASQSPNIFVQSWRYGEFFKNSGEDFFVLGIEHNGNLVGGSLVVTTTARRGKFLYLPYGPIMNFAQKTEEGTLLFTEFCKKLKELAIKFNADFVRVSPFLEDSELMRQTFKREGFRAAPMHVLAENTWILDLSPSEEELFKSMRPTTRNLIRRGEREGVEIKMTQDEAAIDRLIALLQETAQRHKFVPFSKKYIMAEFDAFKENGEVQIFEAYFEGKMVSSAIIFFCGDTAVYRHSGSSTEKIKCQPSYFLQWKVIQEAKKRGLKCYNFWGIAPTGSSPKHPFAGITTFKTGFGGEQIDLLHCQDMPITRKYWLNWLIETIRRLKRGF